MRAMGALSPERGRASGCACSRRCGRRSAARCRRRACRSRPCRGCVATTWRCLCTPPCFAFVIELLDVGTQRLGLGLGRRDRTDVGDDQARREVREHVLLVRRAAAEARALLRCRHRLFLHPQRQAALVELLDDLFERLGAEVRDREEIVLGLLHELADGVDARPLEAVARPLGQVELFDRQVEVGRRRRRRGDLTELEATRRFGQLGDQVDELAERVARRRERVARRDRTVGLDLDAELVVVRRLLDTRRLDRELARGAPARRSRRPGSRRSWSCACCAPPTGSRGPARP